MTGAARCRALSPTRCHGATSYDQSQVALTGRAHVEGSRGGNVSQARICYCDDFCQRGALHTAIVCVALKPALCDYSAIRQPALLSGSASLDGYSIGLHATTAATVPIAVGTATIASPSNPVVATDQRWPAILGYDLAVSTRPFVVAHVEDCWHNLATNLIIKPISRSDKLAEMYTMPHHGHKPEV
jgi:hypothetical protein